MNEELNKILERIEKNFDNLVAIISTLVEEVKKIRENSKATL
jgi:hypothetical protein